MEKLGKLLESRWLRAGAFGVAGVLAMRAVARLLQVQRLDLALRDAVLALGALALTRAPRAVEAAIAPGPRVRQVPHAFGWVSPLPASIH